MSKLVNGLDPASLLNRAMPKVNPEAPPQNAAAIEKVKGGTFQCSGTPIQSSRRLAEGYATLRIGEETGVQSAISAGGDD